METLLKSMDLFLITINKIVQDISAQKRGEEHDK